MTDQLCSAIRFLDKSFGERDQGLCASRAQAAAQIAIAEQMATQTEHLARIRESLNEIASVLLNASGAGGSINVDVVGQ